MPRHAATLYCSLADIFRHYFIDSCHYDIIISPLFRAITRRFAQMPPLLARRFTSTSTYATPIRCHTPLLLYFARAIVMRYHRLNMSYRKYGLYSVDNKDTGAHARHHARTVHRATDTGNKMAANVLLGTTPLSVCAQAQNTPDVVSGTAVDTLQNAASQPITARHRIYSFTGYAVAHASTSASYGEKKPPRVGHVAQA